MSANAHEALVKLLREEPPQPSAEEWEEHMGAVAARAALLPQDDETGAAGTPPAPGI